MPFKISQVCIQSSQALNCREWRIFLMPGAKEMLSVVVFTFHSKAVFVFFYNLNIKICSYQSNIM